MSKNGKPKLLVLASTFPRKLGDGTPGFVLDLALEQARHFEVRVLTPMVPGAAAREVIQDQGRSEPNGATASITVVRYRYLWPFAETLADGAILDNLRQKPLRAVQIPFLLLGLWRALVWQALSFKPSVIHAHWVIPQGLIATLATPWIPRLVTTHGGDIYALRSAIPMALKRFTLKRAGHVTTVNQESLERVVAWGVEPKRVTNLPMGVDTRACRQLAESTQRDARQLVLVGRLVEKKGVENLLQALRLGLAKNCPKDQKLPKGTSVIIIGDGPLREELEISAAGLPVRFLGKQTQQQVLQAFASSGIAMLPSITADSGDQEGLPVTLLEAAAAGAFIIASDLPGINEVVVDAETGTLVPQRDAEAIARAIRFAVKNPEFQQGCVRLMSAAVARFDHSVIGKRYVELLINTQEQR